MLRAVVEAEQRANQEESWKYAESKKKRDEIIAEKSKLKAQLRILKMKLVSNAKCSFLLGFIHEYSWSLLGGPQTSFDEQSRHVVLPSQYIQRQ